MREILIAVLEQAGYDLTITTSAEEALASSGRFDLVISDVVMPGMDGVALARKLRDRGLDAPVLFISGYAPMELRDRLKGLGGARLLPKPFVPGDLLRAVRQALSAGSESTL